MSHRLFKPTTRNPQTSELLKTRQSDGHEYDAVQFGDYRSYFHNRQIKDQNYDAETRRRAIEAGKPQFFRGCVMACKGETGMEGSATDLRRIVVEHGGVWFNYTAVTDEITHFIAEHIRIDARKRFRYTKVVKPSWIYNCEKAGKRLPEELLVIGEAGQRKLNFGTTPRKEEVTPSPVKFKPELPASVMTKARDVVKDESFGESFVESESDGFPSHQPDPGRFDDVDWMPSHQPEVHYEEEEEEVDEVDLVGRTIPSKAQEPPPKESFYSDLFDGIDVAELDPANRDPATTIARSLQHESIQEEVEDFPDDDELEPHPLGAVDGEETYVVEAIVGEKRPRNKRQQPKYLVKWLGYPDSDNTWEAERKLRSDVGEEGFRELLNVFRARNGRRSSAESERRRKPTAEADQVNESMSTSIDTIVDEDDLTEPDEPQLPELPRSSQRLPASSASFSLPTFSSVHLTPDPEELPQSSQEQEDPSASYPTPKADRQSSGKFANVNEIPPSDGVSSPPLSPTPRPKTPTQQSQTISPPLSSPAATPVKNRKRPPEELSAPKPKRLNAPGTIETWPGQTAEEFNRAYLNWRPEGWNQSVQNPDFLDQFFKESRLHQLSTWRSELKARMQAIQKKERPKIDYPRRYVMHVDFDCFFAAVSLRDQPHLADKPVAISHGNSDSSEIASCNYIARDFGVKNGTWMSTARKLCPDIIVLPYEFAKYEAASREFYNVILDLDALTIQSVSIDEALVDITNLVVHDPRSSSISEITAEESRALAIATRVRDFCRQRTRCEVSIGLGGNILLAKLALRAAKPAGQHLIRASEALAFLATRKVRDLPGIGPKTSDIIVNEFGVDSVAEIRKIKPFRLCAVLGPKTGQRVHELCHAIDRTPVGKSNEVERKSYSINVSWGVRFISQDQPEKFVRDLCRELERRMKEDEVVGSNFTLSLAMRHPMVGRKTEKWLGHGKVENTSRSTKLMEPTSDAEVMGRYAASLLRECNVPAGDIRGLGVAMGRVEMVEKGRTAQGKLGFGVVEKKKERSVKETPPQRAAPVPLPQPQQQTRYKPPRFQQPKPASLMGRFLVPKGGEQQKSLPPPPPPPPPPETTTTKPRETEFKTPLKKEEQQHRLPAAVPKAPAEKIITSPGIPSTQFFIPTQIDMSVLDALPESIRAQILEHQRQQTDPKQETAPSMKPSEHTAPDVESEWDEILKGLATQERIYNENWEARIKQEAPMTPSKRKEKAKRQMHLSPSPHKVKGQVPMVTLTRESPPMFPLFSRAIAAAKDAAKKDPFSKKPRIPRTRKPHNPDPSHRPVFHPDGRDISAWLFSYTHITPDFFHTLERQDQLTVIRAAERQREALKAEYEKARNKRQQLQYAIQRAIVVKVPEYHGRASWGVVWVCGDRVVGSRFEEQVVGVIREWVREDGWKNTASRIAEMHERDEETEEGCVYGVGCGSWCTAGFWGNADPMCSGNDHAGPSSTASPPPSPFTSSSAFTTGAKDAQGNWIWPTGEEPVPEGPEEEDLVEWLGFLREVVLGEREMWKAVKFVKTFLREAGWKEGWAGACERTEETLRSAARQRGLAGEIVL